MSVDRPWQGLLRSPYHACEPGPESGVKTWICLNCGFVYEESRGLPEAGIAPGTAWADVPEDWTCPDCGAPKSSFEMVEL